MNDFDHNHDHPSPRTLLGELFAPSGLAPALLDAIEFAMQPEQLEAGDTLVNRRGSWLCALVVSGSICGSYGQALGPGKLVCSREPGTWYADGTTRIARLHHNAVSILLNARSPIAEAFRALVSGRQQHCFGAAHMRSLNLDACLTISL